MSAAAATWLRRAAYIPFIRHRHRPGRKSATVVAAVVCVLRTRLVRVSRFCSLFDFSIAVSTACNTTCWCVLRQLLTQLSMADHTFSAFLWRCLSNRDERMCLASLGLLIVATEQKRKLIGSSYGSSSNSDVWRERSLYLVCENEVHLMCHDNSFSVAFVVSSECTTLVGILLLGNYSRWLSAVPVHTSCAVYYANFAYFFCTLAVHSVSLQGVVVEKWMLSWVLDLCDATSCLTV
jgi:hypothetical protein